eukprot:SAG25_NODE_7_length_29214_cov_40.245818_33_plen_118_part_00
MNSRRPQSNQANPLPDSAGELSSSVVLTRDPYSCTAVRTTAVGGDYSCTTTAVERFQESSTSQLLDRAVGGRDAMPASWRPMLLFSRCLNIGYLKKILDCQYFDTIPFKVTIGLSIL